MVKFYLYSMDKKNFYSQNDTSLLNFIGDKVKLTVDKITNNYVIFNYNETDKKNNCFKYLYSNEWIKSPPNKLRYRIIHSGSGETGLGRFNYYTINYSFIENGRIKRPYLINLIHITQLNEDNMNIVGDNN